jgi:hypothetical protein
MFNLDEALRYHLAQRQKESNTLLVAISVATFEVRQSKGSRRGRRCCHYPQNYHLDDSQ